MMHLEHVRSRERELEHREDLRARMIAKFDIDRTGALSLVDRVFGAIDRAREILIWSFPHAFYMRPASPELRLFEFWQGDVARDVEELTDLVEYETTGATAETLHRAVTVLAASTEVLIRHVGEIVDWTRRQEVVGPAPWPATEGAPWQDDEETPDEQRRDDHPPHEQPGDQGMRLQFLLDLLMNA
jgi:hypothetical protein